MNYNFKQPKSPDNMKIADILILYFLSCDLFKKTFKKKKVNDLNLTLSTYSHPYNGCVHKTFKFVSPDNNSYYVVTVFGD